MWTRAELKERAKAVLKICYWKAFLVSLVIGFVGGGTSAPSINLPNMGNDRSPDAAGSFMDVGGGEVILFLIIGLMIFLTVMIFVLAFRIFLGYPLIVGGRRFYIQAAQNDIDMNYLGHAFTKTKYLNIIKAMFWRGFLIFLWSLLLIIPGIIKAYAYRMTPYILADNPNIGSDRAVELSAQMTKGHKFKMFVLDLSFIGWYLLGLLAFFIGIIFVMPYVHATYAELYLVLRRNALDSGLTSYEELMLQV